MNAPCTDTISWSPSLNFGKSSLPFGSKLMMSRRRMILKLEGITNAPFKSDDYHNKAPNYAYMVSSRKPCIWHRVRITSHPLNPSRLWNDKGLLKTTEKIGLLYGFRITPPGLQGGNQNIVDGRVSPGSWAVKHPSSRHNGDDAHDDSCPVSCALSSATT
jgi:hypothetical protein